MNAADGQLNLYLQMPPLPASTRAQVKIEFPYTPSLTTSNQSLGTSVNRSNITEQLDDNQLWLLPETFKKDLEFIQKLDGKTASLDQFNAHLANNTKSVDTTTDTIKTEEMVWYSKAWLPLFDYNLAMQLEVKYPAELLPPRKDNKGYLFQIKKPLEQDSAYIKAEENTMESTKQGIKPFTRTFIVENSHHHFYINSPNKLPTEPTTAETKSEPIPPPVNRLSPQGQALLRSLQDVRLKPYNNNTGRALSSWNQEAAIGYGHMFAKQDWSLYQQGITQAAAEQLLQTDIPRFEQAVTAAIQTTMTQNEFDALVIFAYNIGEENFASSSVVKLINDPQATTNHTTLEAAWRAWNDYGNYGVKARRQAEWALYSEGIY